MRLVDVSVVVLILVTFHIYSVTLYFIFDTPSYEFLPISLFHGLYRCPHTTPSLCCHLVSLVFRVGCVGTVVHMLSWLDLSAYLVFLSI